MRTVDPLQEFEQLIVRLKEDLAPRVHVLPQVMGRVRAARAASDRTLALLAACSCVAALLAVLLGFSFFSQSGDSVEAILQIVPPIGL